VLDVSRALHLTAPRRWLEDAFDRPHTRPDPVAPAPSTSTTTTTTQQPGPVPTTVTTMPERRTPTSGEPLRLVVAGDSMTESTGPALLDAAHATGVIDGHHELRYSSGLTRPDYFDWPAALRALVAERDPEAIIVFVGANDAQGIETAAGPAAFGSDAWVAEYRSRVAAVMSQLQGSDRTVYWLGQPIMRSESFDDRMRLITDIYRDEASRHPGVRFIDTRPLFATADGSYSAYLPGSGGAPVLVRREDGIHLTPAGAERLARAVVGQIAADWHIEGEER
jgi:hypothetical protein